MHFVVVELLQLSVFFIWLGNPYPHICYFFGDVLGAITSPQNVQNCP